MAATACLRHLSSVGQRRPHVQRYIALKTSSGHAVGSLCSGWVFGFSGDNSSNQNDVCTLPEILLFYTITLPEILALRGSFVLVVRLPGRLRCKHSSFTSECGCSITSFQNPSESIRTFLDSRRQILLGIVNHGSAVAAERWNTGVLRQVCLLLDQDSWHGAS